MRSIVKITYCDQGILVILILIMVHWTPCNTSINNLRDPFIESNYGVHSRQFEVAVLDWFALLWELKEEYWGYITNCGTERNLHGILVGLVQIIRSFTSAIVLFCLISCLVKFFIFLRVGIVSFDRILKSVIDGFSRREVFPDGILYASRETHYRYPKQLECIEWNVKRSTPWISGEIDCEDFKAKLLLHKDKPAIVNVNIGTTVKGAVDDLDLVIQTLEEAGFTQNRFFIHCDGALFGLMMPFVKQAPIVTFKKPIGSVSVSSHKFVGCPMPCGVQITKLEHITALARNVEYLASRDVTIMGSRNGHAPIFLWYTLNRKGYRGFADEVQKCLKNAHYLKDRLRAIGIGAMLNELSSTVVFERPHDEEFVRKWQLACQGNMAHVVVLPNVTVLKIDTFLKELGKQRAIWYADGKLQPPCLASDIGKENCLCASHK